MIEEIKLRLKSLGYEANESDDDLIKMFIAKEEEYIKNFCNINQIPNGLKYNLIERVCGKFLLNMKNTGKLNDLFELDSVKSVSLGDTSVSFDSVSMEKKIDKLISSMIDSGKEELICYRKVKW